MQRGHGRFVEEEEVESLTGCGLFVHRSVWQAVGLLDPRWFVYVEDADFCARARKAGFHCIYVPDAVLEHSGAGSTGGGYSRGRKYLTAYGSVLYLKRHGTLSLWAGFLILDVVLWPVLLAVGVLGGRGAAVLAKGRGMVHGFLGRPVDRGCVER
jgi:GT2 family glycosyltransferase